MKHLRTAIMALIVITLAAGLVGQPASAVPLPRDGERDLLDEQREGSGILRVDLVYSDDPGTGRTVSLQLDDDYQVLEDAPRTWSVYGILAWDSPNFRISINGSVQYRNFSDSQGITPFETSGVDFTATTQLEPGTYEILIESFDSDRVLTDTETATLVVRERLPELEDGGGSLPTNPIPDPLTIPSEPSAPQLPIGTSWPF